MALVVASGRFWTNRVLLGGVWPSGPTRPWGWGGGSVGALQARVSTADSGRAGMGWAAT